MKPEDFDGVPTIQDIAGRGVQPTVAQYREYIAALEAFREGPKRKDFDTEEEFVKAQQYWVGNFVLPPETTFQPRFQAVETLEITPEAISRTKDSISDLIKKEKENEAQFSEEEIQAFEAEQEAAEQTRTARQEEASRGVISVPVLDSLLSTGFFDDPEQALVEPAARKPLQKKLTYNQFVAVFDENSVNPAFVEEFKNTLVDNGYITRVEANQIRTEDLGTLWAGLGLYAAEQNATTGKLVDILDPEVLQDYNEWEASQLTADQDQLIATENVLRGFYVANGVPYEDGMVEQKARRIMDGELSFEAERKRIRENILAKEYPEWADAIKSGVDVRDLAEPYLAQMSRILEIPESQIMLDDPRLRAVLSSRNEKGEKQIMSLSDQSMYLRKLPEWKETANAKNEFTSLSTFVLEKFGFRR